MLHALLADLLLDWRLGNLPAAPQGRPAACAQHDRAPSCSAGRGVVCSVRSGHQTLTNVSCSKQPKSVVAEAQQASSNFIQSGGHVAGRHHPDKVQVCSCSATLWVLAASCQQHWGETGWIWVVGTAWAPSLPPDSTVHDGPAQPQPCCS